MRFKVGDIVRVKTLSELTWDKDIKISCDANSDIIFESKNNTFNLLNKMFKYCGKEYKVKSINRANKYYVLSSDYDDGVDLYVFQDWMLVPGKNIITITTDGNNKTTATNGNKEVSVGLYHEDKYDEFVGAVEALAKLYDRKSPFEEIRELKGEEDPNIKPYNGIKYKLEIDKKPEITEKFKIGDSVRLLNTVFPYTTIYPYKYYVTEYNYNTLNGHIFEVEDTRDYFIHTEGKDYYYQTIIIKNGKHSYSYPSFLFTRVFSEESKFKPYFVRVNKTILTGKELEKLAGKTLLVCEEKGDEIVVNGPKNKTYIIPKKYTTFLFYPKEIIQSAYKIGDRITLLRDTKIARKYSKGTIVEKCSDSYKVIYDVNFKKSSGFLVDVDLVKDDWFRLE